MACWKRGLAAVGLCVLLPLGWGCAGTPKVVATPPPLPPPPPPPVTIILPPPPPPVYSLPADPSFRSPRRPANVVGNLDATLTRRWKYIVIHHSASDSGNEAIFDREHRTRGWRGVGYDFVIDNGEGGPDGRVEATFRWEEQQDGAHAGNEEYNKLGIGICLVGNFDYDRPTAKQMESLVGLINFLQDRCQIPTANILGHTHVRIGGTDCPGKNFPWYDMFSRLEH